MDTYFIAGSAADPDFAKAELLVDKLIKAHLRIELVKDMRHPCEWQDFRQSIVQSRGFSSLGDKAIIWRKDGRLVGGINDFAHVLSNCYKLSLDVDNQLIADITAENLKVRVVAGQQQSQTRRHADTPPLLGCHNRPHAISPLTCVHNTHVARCHDFLDRPRPLADGCHAYLCPHHDTISHLQLHLILITGRRGSRRRG